MRPSIVVVAFLLIMNAMMLQPIESFSQATPEGKELPPYLRDRGTGIPMSIFGTYVNKGEILLYPFYEYYHDNDMEYKPSDYGYDLEQDFRGRYRAHEGIFFIAYGISDKVAVEVEAGIISAKLDKAKDDPSAMPAKLEESGLSDVESQIRWRWNHENASTPEFFSYFLSVFPTGKANSLIGTSDWELKLGAGLIKGFGWGTITPEVGVEYSASDKSSAVAYGLQYLKRLSDRARFFAMLEGTQDEAALIPEIQWFFNPHTFLKANVGFGLTSKAVDIAPEVGIMFSL